MVPQSKSSWTTKHDSPMLFFKSPMLIGKRDREGGREGEGKIEGGREGGVVEMNGSGGFIGCCQGG